MSDAEMKPNTMVALDLKSDLFSSGILALAKVVWCKQNHQGYEVSAEFWWIGWQNDDVQQAIAEYVGSVTEEDVSSNPTIPGSAGRWRKST